ncbi:hypothetical protein [Streptomyces sp. NPDC026659]|uniref:hypothetical protein n=1 Tax=Streptomyces sp. NPDC026659 TaxID=3155123 RepID=UPI0033F5F78E
MKRPSRANPGLHISAPSTDERASGYGQSPSLLELSGNVPSELAGQPNASYACHCGATAEASGVRGVQAVVKSWNDHGRACPEKTERPWERHGRLLPPRSNEGR